MGLELYWIPIKTALLFFPFLALILLLPWLIFNYRKYGFFSLWTSFIVYTFIFYGLCALFLAILPLPASRDNSGGQTALTIYQNLIPFTFVSDIMKNERVVWTSLETYTVLLQDLAFLQVLFNLFMFFPLGVYLKYFRVKWYKVLLISFLVSLFFEVTQRTGIFGYFLYPYRLFDVDDLIINTLGAYAGFVIAPLVLIIFPSKKDVEVKSERVLNEFQVRPFARLLALFIDLSMLILLSLWFAEWVVAIGYLVILIVIPLIFNGATPGTALLHFQLKSDWRLGIAVRAVILYVTRLVYVGLYVIWNMTVVADSELYYYQAVLKNVALLIFVLLTGILMIHGIRVLSLKHIDQFYFDLIAKVFNVRKVKKVDQGDCPHDQVD